MGRECYLILKNENSRSLSCILLDVRCIQDFWVELCDKTYIKKEFIEILKKRVGMLDINCDEFPLLIKVLSTLLADKELVNTEYIYY